MQNQFMYNSKFCHVNVRSLIANFNAFLDYFSSVDYDFIAVSETWLTPNITNDAVYMDGYTLVRKDRDGAVRGGGVGIYIKNNFIFDVLDVNANIENIWVSVKLGKTKFSIGCIYRSPNYNYNEFINNLEESLISLIPVSDEIICLGDFNVNLLDLNSPNVLNFYNIIDSMGLKQIITTPTRITSKSLTLIDIILISEDLNYSDCGSTSVSDIADHELVYVHINSGEPTSGGGTPITYRNIKTIDNHQLYAHLQSIPWDNIYDLDNIDSKVNFFNENITVLMDLHAPLKTCVFKKSYKPWITDDIKELIKIKNKASQKYKQYKTPQNWQNYKDLKNFTTSSIRREKKAFLRFTENDMNITWKKLKQLNIYNKKQIANIPSDLAHVDLINNHFINSIPRNNTFKDLNYYNDVKQNITSTLMFKSITEIEIYKYLFKIKSKAVGSDGIHIDFIHLCCPFILKYICHIVNFCLINSVYPVVWKMAHVTPLPKINNPKDFHDLRPISILPVLSKIIEYIVKAQITDHLSINKILPDEQSGFREGHSCVTAMLNITDHLFSAIDSGLCSVLVLLDYSKAFDTIEHHILIQILKFIGFEASAVNFINHYLSGRQQRVVLKNKCSNPLDISCGVPQGSVLGPLLFTIYTSSFPTFLNNCKIQMYADDTQLFYSFDLNDLQNSCTIINNDLETLYKISLEHSLRLNPIKCAAMFFGRQRDRSRHTQDVNISINNVNIPVKDEVKVLGLTIDSDLRFNKHISNCIKKAISRLKILYNSRHILNTKLKITLCQSLVLSIFNYGDTVYGPCLTAATAQRIQIIQNYCLRFIYGIRRQNPVSHKLKETMWLNMKNLRLLHRGTVYMKIILNCTPPYLYRKIRFRTDIHNLNIRFKGNLTPPFHRTALFERSYSYNIANFYNSLIAPLKSVSLNNFKKKFKQKLLTSQ